MKNKETGFSKAKLGGSYLTLVISVSLVLFLLGILGLVIINAKELSDYFRESLTFSVILDEDAREADIRMLQKDLDAKPSVKSTEYVSKDEAAAKMKEDMGEDFISFLGDNPLPPSIDVYLYAGYTNRDSVVKFEKYILEYPFVKEVWYEDSLLVPYKRKCSKDQSFPADNQLFLFLIAVTIINNTIRLAIYSKRFLIRTMQLVGATRAFIRKPFLIRSIYHGVLAALTAMLLLMGLLYLIEKEFLMLFSFESTKLLAVLGVLLIIAGILINLVSTYLSVNRYLDISEDKLYN